MSRYILTPQQDSSRNWLFLTCDITRLEGRVAPASPALGAVSLATTVKPAECLNSGSGDLDKNRGNSGLEVGERNPASLAVGFICRALAGEAGGKEKKSLDGLVGLIRQCKCG